MIDIQAATAGKEYNSKGNNAYIVNPEQESTFLGSKLSVDLKAGTTLSFRTPGGGGYGHPEERDPNLVQKDVRDGKVSPERAASLYKVAINKDLTVNVRKTRKLRNENL